MRQRKNNYFKVIQECVKGRWIDLDFHETNGLYVFKDALRYKMFAERLKDFKSKSKNIRVINRPERIKM